MVVSTLFLFFCRDVDEDEEVLEEVLLREHLFLFFLEDLPFFFGVVLEELELILFVLPLVMLNSHCLCAGWI